jgi:ATP-dependent protease HslVU (ClpYQ) ATPase subunit
VDEFNRSVDQKSSYFKEDAERVEEEASDLLAHLRDARKQSDQMRVENEQSIVRTEIKNKLVQLETTMQEFVARNGEEDPTTKAMLLFSRG